MLVEAIIMSIVCGFLLNRGKKDFERVSISAFILILLAGVIEGLSQLILYSDILNLGVLIRKYTLLIEIIVYLLIFIFIYMNRDMKGMKVILFGALLNFIAVVSNNGFMMVDGQILLDMGFLNSYNELKEGLIFAHGLIGVDTKFIYLTDIINIIPPYPFPKSISAGDIVLAIGAFIVIINVFRKSTVAYKM